MNKLTDRQKQAIATKLRITKIASELFKLNGFDSVKIQDICEAAGISVGAFYHHFKSKMEIINIAYEQVDILLMDRFEVREFSSNLDKLLFLMGEGADMMEELGWVFVGEIYKHLISLEGKYSTNPDRHITLLVKDIVEDALNAGELDNSISSADLTLIIMRISRGAIFDWCLFQGSYNLKSRITFDLNLILSNFKSKNSD
ncbi:MULTISPECIES: TetR/AcrR family transcriptional regulator [Terrisporobacter]|uniref:TetR/AcrR family transcriptional regulator n=1 Tax=Terrisporobacter muris TaxID=2963284 RepID=A0A9X2M8F1_9FIRM|nr:MULTISPECIES: TetR/AcrR family transcriptional regulator [Terrisporobacter]MCC3668555.1 TetR/AcrR family transcriptional regulator [Terrisporobacter mayombei]MCR1822682.1 TetR/AcrR family transcriptional regulator [Terrisporobacter muris]MDU6984347.1 TetR/AcrR family transcriptional regulator [Terrisporobacter othiniensis]MDY3372248.1 TetR/AcrR family transcriptional regulator [Terrisporobacter othiniensis]